jgi:hypothetical protein
MGSLFRSVLLGMLLLTPLVSAQVPKTDAKRAADKAPGGKNSPVQELARHPERFVGKRFTLEAIVTPEIQALAFGTEIKLSEQVASVRFIGPRSLGEAVSKLAKPQTARLLGSILAPEGTANSYTFEIAEIQLLNDENIPVATLKPTPVAALVPDAVRPTPTVVSDTRPPAPKPASKAWIAGVIGVTIVLLAGIAVGLRVLRKPEGKSMPLLLRNTPIPRAAPISDEVPMLEVAVVRPATEGAPSVNDRLSRQ